MYLAHSERSDSADKLLHHYTDRPWRLLHKVLRVLRQKLDGMFTSIPNPWTTQRHTISLRTRNRILELRAEGHTYETIAKEVELHPVTVGRHCQSVAEASAKNRT